MSEESNIRRAQFADKEGEVVLRDHEYDGIQEYDQKLPNWWLFIFVATFGFCLVYWVVYYNFGLMKTDAQRMQASMQVIEKAKQDALNEMLANLDDKALIETWATDPERTAKGKATYMQLCTACHGTDLHAAVDIGGGKTAPLPGLPLTDRQWKYGNKPMDIFKIINNGTPADSSGHNGARMEQWGLKIPPEGIAELTAFIISENSEEFGVP